MITLGIDTATELVSVALVDGEKVLAASESQSDRRHAEDLTPMLQFVVRRAGIAFSEIDAVAVDVGPGLFTGMRVGIAAAQALAQVLSVPLVGVDSLEALVAGVGSLDDDHEIVVPVVDTRRREVAWALHRNHGDRSLRRVAPPQVGTLEDLLAVVRERSQQCLFVGAYAVKNREQVQADLGPQSWSVRFDSSSTHPHARYVAAVGQARLLREPSELSDAGPRAANRGIDSQGERSDDAVFAPTVQPMYLRDADAEIHWSTRATR